MESLGSNKREREEVGLMLNTGGKERRREQKKEATPSFKHLCSNIRLYSIGRGRPRK